MLASDVVHVTKASLRDGSLPSSLANVVEIADEIEVVAEAPEPAEVSTISRKPRAVLKWMAQGRHG